jgi:hypothetical protein
LKGEDKRGEEERKGIERKRKMHKIGMFLSLDKMCLI